jgi:HAMP domain-containing protein
MALPTLEEMVVQINPALIPTGEILRCVSVPMAEALLKECGRLQHIERMCHEKTVHIADQSEEIEQLTEELDAVRAAAKMPADYQHGLADWITVLLIRSEQAAVPRTKDLETIQRLRAEVEQAHNVATVTSNLLLERLDNKSDEIQRLMSKLARFNLRWQHQPPEIGDTKWVKVEWNGHQTTHLDCGGEA